MRIGLEVGDRELPENEVQEHWVTNELRSYHDIELVSELGQLAAENGLKNIDGLVVDAARPNEMQQEHIVRAHKLGKPVLAFVSTECPDMEIVGDLAKPQKPPLPLADWLELYEGAPQAISISRGGWRGLKLKIWLEAHLRVPPTE